ncbi:MAG: 1-acyl-sn-glycerol-3-phosphate acyltransferase [Flavobacteriales bacterium]
MDDKFIDVERLIASKNPKLLKRLPKFIIKYLKRILHQEEINTILDENKEVFGADFCIDIIKRFNIKVKAHGLDKIPTGEGVIFVSNHPLGGMDAMAIVSEISPIRDDINFIVNDLLLNLKNLKGMFVGVDKHASNAKGSLQKVNELFASDKAVFLFPAGLVSRKKKGVVRDLDWKKTFVSRAKKYNKKIVPVHIDGELTNFFYRLSNLRESIGVKANIEMLYLADQLFKQKDKTMNLYIGDPISPDSFDKSQNDKEIAKMIKDLSYNLAN